MKKEYMVTVDVTVRVKVKSCATSFDEAYDNVISDYDDSSIEDFVSNAWDSEGIGIDEVDCEILDEPW